MKSSAIFTIFKKELARFFGDRRTLIAILLPGFLIYIIYSLMGGAFEGAFAPDDKYVPVIYSQNTPESFDALCIQAQIPLKNSTDIEYEKDMVKNEQADLIIIFPADFDKKVAEYSITQGIAAPNIEIYYNVTQTNSSMAYETVTAILDMYESSMANKFDTTQYDLASQEDMASMIFSMIMPMLLVMLLFSGCMAVAPESISGEKERGTIASLLVTPVKRGHIAIGKILALSIVALLSGISSALGVILSLPKLMGGAISLDGSVYKPSDYIMLGIVILSTVLLLITVISIISAFAKSVKEASSYVTPLMILSMIVGISGMLGATAENPVFYIIPLYNSVQCMIGIFSFEASIVNMAITVVANLIVTSLGVFILAKMFNNEKIMFNK